jgi:O-antigen ligase
MVDTTQTSLFVRLFERERFVRLADSLAVAVAVSLPWSTTATGILIALWAIALVPCLDIRGLRANIGMLAGALPVVLCLSAALGMMWTDVSWDERWISLKVFLRLLAIPLLFVQFRQSDRGPWVLQGFLASCTALLLLSYAQWFFPAMSWRQQPLGVPVKDYIIQSGEFLICAFAFAHLTLNAWQQTRRARAGMLLLLVLLFLANISFVATARTTLVAFVILLGVFVLQRFGWRGGITTIAIASVVAVATWLSSPYLRSRVLDVFQEIEIYQADKTVTSSGFRLEFWKKSVDLLAQAPILGHGTGSQREQFRRVSAGMEGVSALETDNPHNQVFVVAVQLGLVGAAVLFAMWIAHLLLFRRAEIFAWMGAGVVTHNITTGLFNSSLFEFTQGWIYVFGVGVLGGMMLRASSEE